MILTALGTLSNRVGAIEINVDKYHGGLHFVSLLDTQPSGGALAMKTIVDALSTSLNSIFLFSTSLTEDVVIGTEHITRL